MERSDTSSDRLIDDYLRELKVSAWHRGLAREQSAGLQREIRSKIEAALSEAGNRDESTVYGVLDRLGPPSAFVARIADEEPSGARGTLEKIVAPFARLRDVHGWGLAEIGSLLLLIVAPFYVGWVGPILGIILVHAAADRWSDRAVGRATVVVATLFGVQVVIALSLVVIGFMGGSLLSESLWELFSLFGLGTRADTPPFLPSPGGAGLLSPIELLIAAPSFIAGIGSGIYLALSPRRRPKPMV